VKEIGALHRNRKIIICSDFSSIIWPLQNEEKFYEHGSRMYNAISLLNRIFNDAFSPVLLPFLSTTLCSLFVAAVYVGTRLHETMDVVGIVAVPFVLILVTLQIWTAVPIFTKDFEISSHFLQNSTRFLGSSIQTTSDRAQLRRLFKSKRPVRIEVLGNTYYMKRGAKITVFGALLNWSIYLLMTF